MEGTMLFKDEIIKITMLLNEEVVVVGGNEWWRWMNLLKQYLI
jgi:hypothetical protein